MDDLLSEKEQLDALRNWWSEYGAFVIGGVVLGAAILFGWNYQQSSQRDAEIAASALYTSLTDDVVEGRIEAAELTAGRLYTDYSDTPYAPQARLAMARLYMDQNRDQDAANTLRDLIAADSPPGFDDVARLRLAKVLLYQDKPEEVVELLEARTGGAFDARFAEVLGDAYVALDRTEDAREAYQRALGESAQAATVNQTFVQLKLLDLPLRSAAAPAGAPPTSDAADAVDTVDDASGETADDDAAVTPEEEQG